MLGMKGAIINLQRSVTKENMVGQLEGDIVARVKRQRLVGRVNCIACNEIIASMTLTGGGMNNKIVSSCLEDSIDSDLF